MLHQNYCTMALPVMIVSAEVASRPCMNIVIVLCILYSLFNYMKTEPVSIAVQSFWTIISVRVDSLNTASSSRFTPADVRNNKCNTWSVHTNIAQ